MAEYMSMGETTTRLRSSRALSRSGVNIGGVPGAQPNSSSTAAVNEASRSRRLSWVTRRLRVSRLKANWRGGWSTYVPSSSNQRRLAAAARWVDSTTGRRSLSYAARAAGRSGCSWTQAARARASSTASLVPEPMEKCAVWAASPMRTVFPCDQCSLTTVRKVSQEEWWERSGRCPRASAKILAHCRVDSAGSQVSNPAARQTSSRISTMTVEAWGEKG